MKCRIILDTVTYGFTVSAKFLHYAMPKGPSIPQLIFVVIAIGMFKPETVHRYQSLHHYSQPASNLPTPEQAGLPVHVNTEANGAGWVKQCRRSHLPKQKEEKNA